MRHRVTSVADVIGATIATNATAATAATVATCATRTTGATGVTSTTGVSSMVYAAMLAGTMTVGSAFVAAGKRAHDDTVRIFYRFRVAIPAEATSSYGPIE